MVSMTNDKKSFDLHESNEQLNKQLLFQLLQKLKGCCILLIAFSSTEPEYNLFYGAFKVLIWTTVQSSQDC